VVGTGAPVTLGFNEHLFRNKVLTVTALELLVDYLVVAGVLEVDKLLRHWISSYSQATILPRNRRSCQRIVLQAP
jgi:hypothetical protein